MGSPEITIAIIDEDFELARLPATADVHCQDAFAPADHNRHLSSDHGTRLTELIVGSRDGYPGVAPKCRLLLIRLPSICTESEEAHAFDLALQANAAVVCCAWGPPFEGPGVQRRMPALVSAAIERLARESRCGRGALIFFAVGNDGGDVELDGYASHPCIIPVTGVMRSGKLSKHADRGARVIFAAPVSSSEGSIGGELGVPPGASGAAALVAGAAGLAFSSERQATAGKVLEIMWRTGHMCSLGLVVVNAGAAITGVRGFLASRTSFSNKGDQHPKMLESGVRMLKRERRFVGGEHSYFGLIGSQTLQNRYIYARKDPLEAFFGHGWESFDPGVQPDFETNTFLKPLIDRFFAGTGPNQYPGLPLALLFGDLEYGYLVGLAADFYGSPDDLQWAMSTAPLGGPGSLVTSNLLDFVSIFKTEIDSDFTASTDVAESLTSLNDSFAFYLTLAQKNYSHFVGHNLLFYLSYHLWALNDAVLCANSSTESDTKKYFTSALVKEAFAFHYLTDMFSAGHARVPRWGLLYRVLADSPHEADLVSKLLHDFEGDLNVFVRNSVSAPAQYIWKIAGDGKLRLKRPPGHDEYVYRYDSASNKLVPATYQDEPLWKNLVPNPDIAGRMRRYDLIAGLIFASLADVFRHMARNITVSMSGSGGPANSSGLLGYVLDRIPIALPIAQGLAGMAPALANEFPEASDYRSLELSYRLAAPEESDGTTALYKTYDRINFLVKRRASEFWKVNNYQDFKKVWAGLATPAFEKKWVQYMTVYLGIDFYLYDHKKTILKDVPSILQGTLEFWSTVVRPVVLDSNLVLPQSWRDAVPDDVILALIDPAVGVWGIEP